jgi:hypothetical protein
MAQKFELSVLVSALAGCALFSGPARADFEGSDVPIAVKVLYCDYNPRIVVQFADATKNVWYPANSGDQSKEFLSAALAAKVAGQGFYYFGTGDGTNITTYCISVAARPVFIFGLQ